MEQSKKKNSVISHVSNFLFHNLKQKLHKPTENYKHTHRLMPKKVFKKDTILFLTNENASQGQQQN